MLPKDTPTLKASSTGNYTRVDNVFCSKNLLQAIISCDTNPSWWPLKADHYPIITIFDISVEAGVEEARPNFWMTEWLKFIEAFADRVADIPTTEILTTEEFNCRLEALDKAVGDTIEEHVPMAKSSPFTKCWWTADLAIAKKATHKLSQKSYYACHNCNHPIHEEFRWACNDYSELIRKTKMEHWIEGLDEMSVWEASRLATGPASDGGRMPIPTLQVTDPVTKRIMREATTNEEKGKLLFKKFFPPKPATSSVPENAWYPRPRWIFQNITDKQILHTIQKLKPYKATWRGRALNSVIINTKESMIPILGPLFCATNTIKYYLADWAKTQTLVLKKPGKPDYTTPGAWLPIVLSNCFARLLNSFQTEDIVTMCEHFNILPANHFGVRPGCTTTDSL